MKLRKYPGLSYIALLCTHHKPPSAPGASDSPVEETEFREATAGLSFSLSLSVLMMKLIHQLQIPIQLHSTFCIMKGQGSKNMPKHVLFL